MGLFHIYYIIISSIYLATPPISERTTVLYGIEAANNTILQFITNANKGWDNYIDKTADFVSVGFELIRKAKTDAKNKRGMKIRAITEITKDNIQYCKEYMKIITELRHLDGVRGNFAVSESEYIAVATLQEAQLVTQVIYSSVKKIVEQHRYIFETLWRQAIPAEQKISEIEEGIISIRTGVIINEDEIITEIRALNNAANKLSICATSGGMKMSYNYVFDSYKNVLNKYKRGESKEGIRWLTNIDKDNIDLVRIFLKSGIQVRHIKHLPPLSFGVSHKEVGTTIEKMEGGRTLESLLVSNEPLYVNHFNSLFEEFWKNGIDAEGRIKDIKEGVDLADIEVIPSSAKAQEMYLSIVRSATEEILLIFPTINAFIRQEKIGVIQLAKEAAKDRNVKVRILMPTNSLIKQKLQRLEENYPGNVIDVRCIAQMSETKSTILVVDRKASLVMELKDDSKTTFAEAVGLSTYSNSKAGVSSYVAIFENLWRQTELYDQLKEAHEQLKRHDIMQRDFINIAAHELRTPIQPILSLTDVLSSKIKEPQQQELLNVTIRNAKRLQHLTEDILDVTKIESHSLDLKKAQFNLNDVITNAIDDIMTNKESLKTEKNLVKLQYNPQKDIFVEADKGRISEVIHNLLDNALKFTEDGTISITDALMKKEEHENKGDELVIVSVKDTGIGIDSQIFPRLFEKFATKSEATGTGLGLFISKSIVEAHGGRIWAQNNGDSKGATFSFSLPITS
jgi:two-component system, OmpR family, sensor histidine kinase VicK